MAAEQTQTPPASTAEAPVAHEAPSPTAPFAASGDLGLTLARVARLAPSARASSVAALQRGAGNAAIARAAASGRTLARYEAGEHAQFGGPGRTLKVGTVEITEAELQAMGDFYKDPESMVADAKANAAFLAIERLFSPGDFAYYASVARIRGGG